MNSTSAISSASPLRRRLLIGGVAVAAAAAGVAWYRPRPASTQLAEPTGPEAALWALNLESPTGAPVAMTGFRGKPLAVNFWATWCPPCVEELPLLDRFYRENAAKGWQVVGMAIDQPSAVRTFLQKTPVTFPIAMAGLGGTDLVKSLGNLSGGLPFTVVLGSDGTVRHRKMGQISPTDLQMWTSLT
ncbi:redoxin [Rhodoferax koreense]|uniref:Redoxin n=1 Tax=Rhodoferax koreensis TaxID=1842727 RepID=A0A1P8K140_9BURK|nr:TlpA disulfide reductase family protein [Rhodoferax koreense]APW39717.1 redoxin [Rhodoferax koreense]